MPRERYQILLICPLVIASIPWIVGPFQKCHGYENTATINIFRTYHLRIFSSAQKAPDPSADDIYVYQEAFWTSTPDGFDSIQVFKSWYASDVVLFAFKDEQPV